MEMERVSPETVARLRAGEGALLAWARRLGGRRAPVAPAPFTSTAGYRIAAMVSVPEGPGPHPGLVLCPDEGEGMAGLLAGAGPVSVAGLRARGFAVLVFDPAGRGASWGEEDHGGPEHQDEAAVAVRTLAAHPSVDARRVGLVGLGAGSATALGAAARMGAPAAWVLDWEGPADRETAGGRLGAGSGPDDATWWADRAPAGMLAALGCPYVRLQAEDDHARPGELRHAHRMMWAAAATGRRDFQINEHPPGEATPRPVWLASGPLAARAALYRKLAVLQPQARAGSGG